MGVDGVRGLCRARPRRRRIWIKKLLTRRFGISPKPCVMLCSPNAGWSSSVARWAHNPEVAGSNPVPATTGRPRRDSLRGLFLLPYRLPSVRRAPSPRLVGRALRSRCSPPLGRAWLLSCGEVPASSWGRCPASFMLSGACDPAESCEVGGPSVRGPRWWDGRWRDVLGQRKNGQSSGYHIKERPIGSFAAREYRSKRVVETYL